MKRRTIAVFGSSLTDQGSPEGKESEKVGEALAAAGFAVVTGGYGGTMEAVSRGALKAGGHVIGVTAPSLFPNRSGANPHVTEVLEAPDLAGRIGRMLKISAGCVAMPGSIGTAAELLLAWNTNHILRRSGLKRIPVVAVGKEWETLRRAVSGDLGADESDVHWAATGVEAVGWITENLNRDIERSPA